MKILYCNKYNFPFSGTETYLFDLMELMRSGGHDAALFSMADSRGKATQYDRHFVSNINFAERGFYSRARQAARAIYSVEARHRIRDMIADFQPDVAHIRNIYHHISPSILWELKARNIPVLYHLNDFKLLCPSYNMVSKGSPCEKCAGGKFRHVVQEGCYSGPRGSTLVLAAEAYIHKWLRTYQKCVTRFLAPTHFVKDKLVESGWNAEQIEVLPHFQTPSRVGSPSLDSAAPILYFGRLSSEKGLTELLQAMKCLPEIHLEIAGEGPQRAELEQLARKLGLANVVFSGYVQGDELASKIRSSRFTVFPSRAYETLGKSILESFAEARPVIASDLGSRRELVQHGKTGILFRPRDVGHLAQSISQLYHAPQTVVAMGKAAREFIERKHSRETHYAEMLRIYTDLAAVAADKYVKRKGVRVAFIGGRGVISKYSGIETYYEEAGKRLVSAGHEVTLYCRSYFTPLVETHNRMRVVRLPTIRTKHLETFVHTLLSTIHAMFSDCEIVHYHALGPALFSFLPRLVGKKTLVTVQGLDWKRKKWGWVASAILQLGERAAIAFPNKTMVVSKTLQTDYLERYRAQTNFVPNGTLVRRHNSDFTGNELGLESGKYILFLGRLSPEKNCHLLIEAYEHLNLKMKLVLAGGSSYSDSYASELLTHRSNDIRILDWLCGADLNGLLTNAGLFVLPSDIEGMSLALLDAMGAGVCVLSSDIPENRELVDGVAYTFKNGDCLDLERMLTMLTNSVELRAVAAKKAQKRIKEQYLWPLVTQQIGSIYLDMMGKLPAPPLRPPLSATPKLDHTRVA